MNVFLFFVSLFVCVQDASAAMDATMAYWEQVLRVLLPRSYFRAGAGRAGGLVRVCLEELYLVAAPPAPGSASRVRFISCMQKSS